MTGFNSPYFSVTSDICCSTRLFDSERHETWVKLSLFWLYIFYLKEGGRFLWTWVGVTVASEQDTNKMWNWYQPGKHYTKLSHWVLSNVQLNTHPDVQWIGYSGLLHCNEICTKTSSSVAHGCIIGKLVHLENTKISFLSWGFFPIHIARMM